MIQIDWHPNRPALQKFGVTTFIGFVIVGAIFFFAFDEPTVGLFLWGFGAFIAGGALSGWRPLGLLCYRIWMGLGLVMGTIVSTIVMAAIYWLVVTPVGLLSRVARRDELRLREDDQDTYWEQLEEPSRDLYERQF